MVESNTQTLHGMKLAIMQPYFFPYIGYFQAITAVDKYILYDNLTFIKEAWMNRNRILLRDGRIQMMTVPLKHKSSNALIRDIEIDNSKPWKKNLLSTISGAYKRAPYFDEIFPFIDSLLSSEYVHLSELNCRTISGIVDYLGIDTIVESDNSKYLQMESTLSDIESDYSVLPYLNLTKPIRKVARVLEMCREEGADVFINAIGGQELYDKSEFLQYGIDLRFVKTNDIIYSQSSKSSEFVPNLSIVDVLMNNGKEGTKTLLNEYRLV